MKLARFEVDQDVFFGVVDGDRVKLLEGTYWDSLQGSDETVKISEVKLLAPINPSKIVCVGLNYREHIKEINAERPEMPHVFLKPTSCLIGHEDTIMIPEGSERTDYEGELAVVVKDRMKNVSEDQALSHVLGYSCFNDVTERALVFKSMGYLTQAKGYDTFGAFGPYIETDVNPDRLEIKTYLNGNVMQADNTESCIFNVPYLLSFVSRCMTLYPGDVLITGTPKGVAQMNSGDIVEVEIEGIGTLRNPVK
jgi:2-keto-4-pentenoate hydratase/2-oxohepta-3-ene-1,7-dioic acid hydratase in catechol pathway